MVRTRIILSLAGVAAVSLTMVACGMGSPVPRQSVGVDRSVQTRSVFSMPRMGFGGFSGGSVSSMPVEEVQCRQRLRSLGVKFTDLAPIREGAACGIDWPIEVTTLARGVALTPAATLNCATAESSARWLQGDAGMAARSRYLSGIAEVRQMSSYSCRQINGTSKWSEHSKGNALDIGSFKLKNGRVIDVAKPGFFALRERGFLNSVRASACSRFGTVLGPGDKDHADHFHFDMRQRNQTYCSL